MAKAKATKNQRSVATGSRRTPLARQREEEKRLKKAVLDYNQERNKEQWKKRNVGAKPKFGTRVRPRTTARGKRG